MDARKNFEAYTNLETRKKNAIKLCDQEFIKSLTKQKIYAQDDEFWIEVNKHLNIPDDYYEQKLIKQEEEQKRKRQEEKTEEKRLMDNRKLVKEDNRLRDDWSIKVFQLCESKILKDLSQKYLAEGTLIGDDRPLFISDFSDTLYQARDKIVSKIDQYYEQQEEESAFLKRYKVLKQIYLMFLYVSGWDNHSEPFDPYEEPDSAENFLGRRSWIHLDFSILDKLKEEGLLKQPQREGNNPKKTTYVDLTPKGLKLTRELLKNIDLEEVDKLLEDWKYHEYYLGYQNYLDSLKKIENQRQE